MPGLLYPLHALPGTAGQARGSRAGTPEQGELLAWLSPSPAGQG